MISTLLGPHVTAFIVDALALLAAYSILWATVKLSYERAVGKPMPRTALVLVFDVFAELAVNLPGAFNRATGGAVFASPKDTEIARLRARVADLAGDRVETQPPGTRPTSLPPPAALGVLCVLLVGCPKVTREPSPEPPRDGCAQGATLCHQGHPWVCGPGGRWSQADRRCDRMGVACCLAPSPYDSGLRHACVPASACVAEDGGVR